MAIRILLTFNQILIIFLNIYFYYIWNFSCMQEICQKLLIIENCSQFWFTQQSMVPDPEITSRTRSTGLMSFPLHFRLITGSHVQPSPLSLTFTFPCVIYFLTLHFKKDCQHFLSNDKVFTALLSFKPTCIIFFIYTEKFQA